MVGGMRTMAEKHTQRNVEHCAWLIGLIKRTYFPYVFPYIRYFPKLLFGFWGETLSSLRLEVHTLHTLPPSKHHKM